MPGTRQGYPLLENAPGDPGEPSGVRERHGIGNWKAGDSPVNMSDHLSTIPVKVLPLVRFLGTRSHPIPLPAAATVEKTWPR